MRYPERPTIAFFAALLVLVPLPWHWRARNIATLSLTAWLFAVNAIYGVNSIIWADNVRNIVPLWCDICSKIILGASYALPISTLCVCKHLEAVSSSRKITFGHFERKCRIIFESAMCFGLPLVFMALHYIVQGHRFDIIENIGCQPTVYVSLPAVFLIWVPQLSFSLTTMIYAILALRNFIQRRLVFATHLQNSNSALTPNRYLRLIAMAVTTMVWATFCTAYNLTTTLSRGLFPWTSWEDVHADWLRVDLWPQAFLPPEILRPMLLLWWAMPVSGLIFFLFFGFGEEAMKEYSKVWRLCAKAIHSRGFPSQGRGENLTSDGGFSTATLAESASVPFTQQAKVSEPLFVSVSSPSVGTLVAPPLGHSINQASGSETHDEINDDVIDCSASRSSPVSVPVQLCGSEYDHGTSRHTPSQALPQDISDDSIQPNTSEPSPSPETPRSRISPPHSPATPTSEPESPNVVFYRSPQLPGCLPSPVYHRPFSGPTICPKTQSNVNAAPHAIVVNIQRQRETSIDEIV